MKEKTDLTQINEEIKAPVFEAGMKEENKNAFDSINLMKEHQLLKMGEGQKELSIPEMNLKKILAAKREEVRDNMPKGYTPGFSPISEDLANMIEMAAQDSGHAPRFKKVRALAKAYLDVKKPDNKKGEQPDDGRAAAALGDLYAGVIEYLMERKSDSSADRKALSEAMAAEIENYMVTVANPDYLKEVNDKIRGKNTAFYRKEQNVKKEDRKENLYSQHIQSLSDSLRNYYGTGDVKEVIKLKKDRRNRRKTPPTLQELRLLEQQIVALKDNYIPNTYKDEKQFNDDVAGAGLMFTVAYNKYIEALKQYIAYNEERKSQNQREAERMKEEGRFLTGAAKDVIRPDLLDFEASKEKLVSVENEFHTLHNAITEYMTEHPEGLMKKQSDIKWGQMIAERGKIRIHIDNQTKNVGEGTSDVFVVPRSEDRKQYVKPAEEMAASASDVWKDTFEEAKTMDTYDVKYQTELDNLDKFVSEKVLSNIDRAQGDEKKLKNLELKWYVCIRTAAARYARGEAQFFEDLMDPKFSLDRIEKYMEQTIGANAKSPFFDYLKGLRTNKDKKMKKFMGTVLASVSKKYNSYTIAKYDAKIKPGESLAGRNVAISRLAAFFGLSDMVPRSELGMVDVKGKNKINLIMDDAQGENIYDLRQGEATYSVSGATAVIKMMFFDSIGAQIDRNTGNYKVQCSVNNGKKTIDGIRLIDNDMSLGILKGADIMKGKTNRLNAPDAKLLMALPEETKKILRDFGDDSKRYEDYIRVLVEDVLGKDQIECLINRIKTARFLLETADMEMQQGLHSVDDKERQHYEKLRDSEAYRVKWYISEKQKEAADKGKKLSEVSYFMGSFVDENDLVEINGDAVQNETSFTFSEA